MNRSELTRAIEFKTGRYQVECVLGEKVTPLLELTFDTDDDPQGRNLSTIKSQGVTDQRLRTTVANALVRAGARHPGLDYTDLARLHSIARKERHIELFIDINALIHGLAAHIAQSLGHRVARIVVSSSSIDVLHEYQSFSRRHHDGSPEIIAAWELARGLRTLQEFRVPVYIHQLAPGAARYFRRGRADGRSGATDGGSDEYYEENTYVSEDRQMIAAFWNYLSNGGPRIPIILVTSDLSLAHVCAAEKLPFIFGKAPREVTDPIQPDSLWFDPFCFTYRTCTPHAILWELCLVLGTINVRVVDGAAGFQEFGLRYEPRNHRPGTKEGIEKVTVVGPGPGPRSAPVTSSSPHRSSRLENPKDATSPGATRSASAPQHVLKLSLSWIAAALPTSPGQRIPVSLTGPADEDEFWRIGAQTKLYSRDGEHVVEGETLPKLLTALKDGEYMEVNRIFRAVPEYDRIITESRQSGKFPSSRIAGAARGWAVALGAAYKQLDVISYGLENIEDSQFEQAIIDTHSALSEGKGGAVPLARVLDRVCIERRISPIRFEFLLNRTLGRRRLGDFEAQRALSKMAIPSHVVLVYPSSNLPGSYLRKLSPGEGIMFGGKLVGSLVRRTGRQ